MEANGQMGGESKACNLFYASISPARCEVDVRRAFYVHAWRVPAHETSVSRAPRQPLLISLTSFTVKAPKRKMNVKWKGNEKSVFAAAPEHKRLIRRNFMLILN